MFREGAARRPLSFKGYARDADRKRMASQLRLQVLAPIAIVAVLGLAVSAFVMSRNQPGGTDADAVAARIAAKQHQSPTKPKPKPEPTATTPATPPKPPHKSHPQGSSLKVALAHHPVVVVLFYSPNASYDAIATREARAGALAANAGFVTVNVLKNSQVAKLAAQYGVLESPTVLVFSRGPKLRARLEGYNDRTTIVQAVENA
jgi:type IV secretory pathway VirB10-like protein